MIFNIQRCSIHDGSGLRTLVFFKGCPLRCLWCANPESQSYRAEIMESPVRCIGCGVCQKICPESAIVLRDGELWIDRSLCKGCLSCTDRCYAESKRVAGKEYTIEELFAEINKDRLFYTMYGGGVTFSGGEPLTQPEFLTEIAKRCRKAGVHTAVESCGYGIYDRFEEALPYIGHMFIDVKHIDSQIHEQLTGVGNELILENVRRIAESGVPVTVRTPVVPGCNASWDNIAGIAEFLAEIPGIDEYELLPYHNLGASKYKALGRPYALNGVQPPETQEMRSLVKRANEILQDCGKTCYFVKDNEKEVIL